MSRATRVAVVGIVAVVGATAWVAGAARGSGQRPAPAPPTGNERQTGITIQGQGRVYGVPDVLRLDVGVEVRRASVQSALDAANAAASKVTRALRSRGVAARDIQTTGVSIHPDYDYTSNTPRIRGYVVSNHVRAKIRDLKRAGDTIQAVATSAGNDVRIGSISFDLEDNQALLKAARDAAFAEAKAKAEQYASLSGRRLGEVVSISETVSNSPPPVAYGREYAAAGAPSSVPISPGQQEVAVLVSVVYAFA